MIRYIILLILILPTSLRSLAQDNPIPMRYSFQEGTQFYFSDRAIGRNTPHEGIVRIRVSRDNGRGGMKALAEVAMAENAQAFKNIAGEQAWQQLKIMKNLNSDEQMYQYLLQNPSLQEYGMLAFSMRFRQAMGTAYVDRDAGGLAAGKRWTYRVEFVDGTGSIVRSSTATIQGGQGTFSLSNVRMQRAFATDSAVYLTWGSASPVATEGMITAEVYRQVAGRGRFTKLEDPVIANMKQDSVVFHFHEAVTPQTLYRYYVRPKDAQGNPGIPSDTISVLSVDFASLPLMQELTARDSVNAIFLRWQSLRNVPQVVGIEIQRSRDARGNYVVLDTVSTSLTTYVDTRIFPDIPYFYRLRILGLKGMERETGYSAYATAVVKNNLKHPDPPYNFTAVLENGNVKLQWQESDDSDLYGYFVYRAASEQGRFEVISPGLTQTEYTDTSRVSGRSQYVYAVKAVNNNSLESDFSNKVSIRQSMSQLPVAPNGINAYMDNRTVVLSWPSMARLDHNIAGYNVYRRESRDARTFDSGVSAAAQAAPLGFILLNNQLITRTGFEDADVPGAMTYEYAISSIDIFGIESTFSPFASLSTQTTARLIRSCTIRKVSGGVMLEWDAELVENTEAVVVLRKKAGDANFQRVSTLRKGETSYLDRNAERGVLYIYQITGQKGSTIISRSEEKNIRL